MNKYWYFIRPGTAVVADTGGVVDVEIIDTDGLYVPSHKRENFPFHTEPYRTYFECITESLWFGAYHFIIDNRSVFVAANQVKILNGHSAWINALSQNLIIEGLTA